MRITALQRGGLAVYAGHYDPHRNEAVALVRDGESVAVTIDYPSAPSAITTSASGVTTTTPTVSGTKATLTLSALSDAGYIDITATVSAAPRVIRIRAKAYTQLDRYNCGPEFVGA